MIKRLKFICITAGLFLLGNQEICKAQETTMEQTLEYINKKLAGKCSMDVIKGVVTLTCSQQGKPVREDQAAINSLDINSIKYDAAYNIMSIDCKGAPSKKCVTRDLFVLGLYRDYARIGWEVSLNEKGIAGMKKALTHMMKLVMEPKYKSIEIFE